MTGAWQRGLYAITDPALIPAAELTQRVVAALAGGAVLIQYRDKTGDPAQRAERARAVLKSCHAHSVPLLINDDLELAAAIGADGVHLGRDDVDSATARQRLGARAIVGVSCYNQLPRAAAAAQAGADYVAFGRFFPSRTKPNAVQAELEVLRRAKRVLKVPVAAIGGIDTGNGPALIDSGADLLAVIHGVFGQDDVTAAARGIAALFGADSALSKAI